MGAVTDETMRWSPERRAWLGADACRVVLASLLLFLVLPPQHPGAQHPSCFPFRAVHTHGHSGLTGHLGHVTASPQLPPKPRPVGFSPKGLGCRSSKGNCLGTLSSEIDVQSRCPGKLVKRLLICCQAWLPVSAFRSPQPP